MKKYILLLTLILTGFICLKVSGQDTLPKFSVKNIGNNRIIISWTNNYHLVKQISVQRSADSLKNYKTILTVPDPMNKSNGFADTKAPRERMFYRLFIVLDKSMFIFSTPKRPVIDTSEMTETEKKRILDPFSIEVNKPGKGMDSVLKNNGLDSKNKPNIFVPSLYIYTSRDGNIHLNLPDAGTRKYSVKFYDDGDNFLFELKNLKESSLIIDKANFYHAGWFRFELFIDDNLKEKHKFYLEKEF